MRRLLLAGLFIVALFAMLCVGFLLGAFFSPALGRVGQVLEQGFSRSGINSSREQPGSRGRQPNNSVQTAQTGAAIIEVTSGSPAEQAGLKPGEIIFSLNGQTIHQPEDLINLMAKLKPGDTVSLEVVQSDQTKTQLTLKLGENPERKETAWLGVRVGPSTQISRLPDGNDSGQLPTVPHNFSLNPGLTHPGALISNVLPGSPAEQAGLKAGQMIQSVDGVKLQGSNSLSEIVASHKPGDTITMTIFNPAMQTNQTQDVKVKLGENPDKPGAAWLGIYFTAIENNTAPKKSPGG